MIEDRHAAFAAEALTLRALIAAASHNRSAQSYGGGATNGIVSSVTFAELIDRYEKLMAEWVHESPDTHCACAAFLGLAKSIIVDEIGDKGQASCQDLFYAVTLIATVEAAIDQRRL
jgi:hypothetical protein